MKKNTFLLILLMIVFSACEKNVIIEVPEKEPSLVVNSLLEKNQPITLTVGRSRHILAPDEFPSLPDNYLIKNAIPVIYQNGVAIDTLKYQPTYEYTTQRNTIIRDGFTYSIKVMAPGYKDVEASTNIPSQSMIAEIRWNRRVRTSSYGMEMDDIYLKLNDPGAEKNFYLIKIFSPNYGGTNYAVSCVSTTDKDIEFTGEEADPLDNESCFDGNNLLMKDDNFNGAVKQVKFSVGSDMIDEQVNYNTGQVYRAYIKVYRITQEHFKFAKSTATYLNNDENPFAEPVNVFTNINGGYGIFSAYTVAVDSLR